MLIVLRARAVKPEIEANDFGTRISFGWSPTFWREYSSWFFVSTA